ncbi:hypothetical protein C0Q70_01528 [Pomacea canaliculata]|uniref:Ependymin-like protein n=1 Tax=Pomacea canaliculata TaxID=400727 RepID=A0A2T7PZQ0_POMCA|nr:hypothetical protein C0Q70_01528 [Pomacea canaliculata]
MMIIQFAFLLTLVTHTTCQTPAKCCFAPQSSATLVDLYSVNGDLYNVIDGEFDFVAGKQAQLSSTHNPYTGVSNYTLLEVIDFNKGKEYIIPWNDPTKCFVVNWPIGPTRCIPDDAMYLGSTYLGPVSTLPYDGWRFKLPGANITISLAVSTSGCVPIVEGIRINDNPRGDELFLFTEYEPRIRNPDWFDLPSSCPQ